MKLNQIEIFCKIFELKSFSKAAEVLHLTQPTLTEHMKSLEQYLGTPLIDRLGREVVPTKAGEVFYEYCQKILNLKKEAEQKIKEQEGTLKGELKIGASTIPGEYILPHLIKNFYDNFPEIFITLKVSDTRRIIGDILDNRIELGIIGAIIESSKLEYHKFVKDELVLVVPSQSPWGKCSSITLKKLKEIPLLFREEGSGTQMVIERYLRDHQVNLSDLKVIMRLGSTTAVIQGVKSGVGCSILSRRAIQEDLANGTLKLLPIDHLKIFRDFYIVLRRGKSRSLLCEVFLNFLLKEARSEVNPS